MRKLLDLNFENERLSNEEQDDNKKIQFVNKEKKDRGNDFFRFINGCLFTL